MSSGPIAALDHVRREPYGAENPSNMEFQFLNSKSPMVVSSPSGTSPSLIESDEDVGGQRQLPRRISITKSGIIRPIPKRISQQYYEEAHQEGLTLTETNKAAMMAHDWHRKWTHQDEMNHTMPDQDFYATRDMPVSYAFDATKMENAPSDEMLICLEREEGAKNPSLGSSPEESPRVQKRVYSSPEKRFQEDPTAIVIKQSMSKLKGLSEYRKMTSTVSSTEAESTSEEDLNRQAKRQFTGISANTSLIEDDDSENDESTYESLDEDAVAHCVDGAIQRPMPIRVVPIRPVALRANQTDYLPRHPPVEKISPYLQTGRHGRIPRDITTTIFGGEHIVSPMGHSQLTGSSTSSPRDCTGGYNDMVGMTVLRTDQEGPHLVEDYEEPASVEKGNDLDNIVKDRDEILQTLAITDGDVESEDFQSKVNPLEKHFLGKEVDTRNVTRDLAIEGSRSSVRSASVTTAESIEGMWLTLSKPNWFGKLGQNDNGDPMYTLGRMSFDMFSPTNLVCSLQGNFNQVEVVDEEDRKKMLDAVPKKLREEVQCGKSVLRTYHIVTAFTIEPSMAAFPNAPNRDVMRPIKGIMTTYGYSLPDPNTPNRHSIWFTGGRIEPNNDPSDIQLWKDFFKLHPPKHSFGEKAKLLAVKLLMGATVPEEIDPVDGSMSYVFTRPLGGHGMAYVDVVYLDESLRIVRGQRGTTFVFSRVNDI